MEYTTDDSDSFTPRYQFLSFPKEVLRSNNSVNKTSGGGGTRAQKDRVYRGRPNKSGEEGRGFWWADRKLKPSISATL